MAKHQSTSNNKVIKVHNSTFPKLYHVTAGTNGVHKISVENYNFIPHMISNMQIISLPNCYTRNKLVMKRVLYTVYECSTLESAHIGILNTSVRQETVTHWGKKSIKYVLMSNSLVKIVFHHGLQSNSIKYTD